MSWINPPPDFPRGSLRQRVYAYALAHFNQRYEQRVESRKRRLFADLQGDILEIGPGAGPNLKFLPRDIHWVGIDPNPFMNEYLRQEALQLGRPAEVRRGNAERMEVRSGSVDAVISTLVLCSVSDVAAVLREIFRVLRPGGKFFFVEHVAAPRGTWHRAAQRTLRPVTRFLADNCHPDRETWAALEASDFREVNLEHFDVGVPIYGPHIMGVATK